VDVGDVALIRLRAATRMKLRILGDTVRLRLLQSEVARLREHGRVQETIHFGGDTWQAITYVVRCDVQLETLAAALDGLSIVVKIPEAMAHAWADGDEISLEGTQPIGGGRELGILIEKDFKCLVPREGTEDSDAHEHPGKPAPAEA